jgi:CheY-like chemotaxis protein
MNARTRIVPPQGQRSGSTSNNYLQGKGYSVAALESGESALEYLRRCAPNVLLLDIFMPGINGLEVLRMIKRECPQTDRLLPENRFFPLNT